MGKTWEQIEQEIKNQIETEQRAKEEKEAERVRHLEELQKMTFAEYIAHRSGLPMQLSNDELGKLTTEEYIKERSKRTI